MNRRRLKQYRTRSAIASETQAKPTYMRAALEALEVRRLLAADTLWTLDSAQSAVTLSIPDQVLALDNWDPLEIRFRDQTGSVTAPWTTNTMQIGGQLATNYSDGTSIQFVAAESLLAAIASGSYRPNFAAFDSSVDPPIYTDSTTAPANIGAGVLVPAIGGGVRLANLAIANLTFETSSALLEISGGTFPANTTTFGTAGGQIGIDGNPYNIFESSLDSLGTPLVNTNLAMTGSISILSQFERQLTLPLSVPIEIQTSEGSSPLHGTLTGQLVAMATVNLPPVVDPNGVDPGNYSTAWTWAPVNIVDASNSSSGATIADLDNISLNSLTVTLSESGGTYTGGNLLTANTAGTSIAAAPFDGTNLVLSGTDTLAHYQQVLRTIQYTNTLGGPGAGVSETVTYTAVDTSGNVGTATSTIAIHLATHVAETRGDGEPRPIAPGEVLLRNNLEYLDVSFSQGLSTDGGATGAHSVENPANWQLLRNGIAVGGLQIFSSYSDTGYVANLHLANGDPLPVGHLRSPP